MPVDNRLAEIAEDLIAFLPPSDAIGARRVERPGVVLRDAGRTGRDFANVCRIRLGEREVAGAVAASRYWFGRRGQPEHQWWLGPSSTPASLPRDLEREGLVPEPFDDGRASAMVLTEPPAGSAAGVEVRRVRSLDDLRRANEIDLEVWGATPEQRTEVQAGVPGRWEWLERQADVSAWLALLDGEPAACGWLVMTGAGVGALLGGSTLPAARGRGLYRALVAARWDAALAAGGSAVAVQASSMSGPVLRGLGFREVAQLQIWADLPASS